MDQGFLGNRSFQTIVTSTEEISSQQEFYEEQCHKGVILVEKTHRDKGTPQWGKTKGNSTEEKIITSAEEEDLQIPMDQGFLGNRSFQTIVTSTEEISSQQEFYEEQCHKGVILVEKTHRDKGTPQWGKTKGNSTEEKIITSAEEEDLQIPMDQGFLGNRSFQTTVTSTEEISSQQVSQSYARCTRSVSIVPPAYYAHLLAFRARYYISEVENSDSGSASGNRSATNFVSTLPSILENVKEVMFYC
ncbi:hypothetical protein KIW84_035040 [Lathyrus oleraceus]|uniref:Uncharacterized protein n=1 Tax=Pisum sativum TaxID=3888 RepID=A0A9D5B1W2_PEA|nr:hypothetical protein KIW84_035040 [Pisum sativum]